MGAKRMVSEPRNNRIVFEDGCVREFRTVTFGSHSIVADGEVFLYSQVDEVHLMED